MKGNTMSNDLVLIEDTNALEVFTTERGTDKIIEQIRQKVNAEVYDVSTEEGRARMRSVARQIGSSKARLQEISKRLTEGWRTQTKAVTSETTRMSKELDELRDEVKRPADEFKAKEDARIVAHEDRLQAMLNTANFQGFNPPCVEELKDTIKTLNLLHTVAFDDSPQDWQEFSERANFTYEKILGQLNGMLAAREKADAEQAELERLRAQEEKRKVKEEQDRIAKEAAEKATLESEAKATKEAQEAQAKAKADQDRIQADKDAADLRAKESEQARIDAEAKAESDRQAAVERERKAKEQAEDDKEAAIQVERKRQKDEATAKASAESARAADQAHKGKINREARDDIMLALDDGYSEQDAENIVVAIASGNVRHTKINY